MSPAFGAGVPVSISGRSFRVHESVPLGKPELLPPAGRSSLRQPADERAVQRQEDDDPADRAALGEDIDCPNGRGRGNGAVPTGKAAVAGTHLPGEHVRPTVEKRELQAPPVRETVGGHTRPRDQRAVGVARGVEASGKSGVGVVALSLGGIAAEPPCGHGERRRKKQKRGDEPDTARPSRHLICPRPPVPQA